MIIYKNAILKPVASMFNVTFNGSITVDLEK